MLKGVVVVVLVEAFVVDELGGVEPADYKAEPRA